MDRLALAAFAILALAACNRATPERADASPAEAVRPAPIAQSEPAFVGAWATEAAYCELGPDDPDSPMQLTARGYDQYEAHCAFASVTPAGDNIWEVKGQCATALNQDVAFKIEIEGDRLTMSSANGTFSYVRCPAS